MSDGGKGSKPRPLSITQQEYDSRWDAIFGKDEPNDFQDILSTEDCMLECFEKRREREERETRNNLETQQAAQLAKN